METKPFAIGLRVEHAQAAIDFAQYGALAGHPRLGAAEYHLAWRSKEYKRNAYTFCMCPGGRVVAAASEQGGVVTNGMSEFARDSGVANSAVVVSVGPADFSGDDPLAGMEFQRQWERRAYRLGGGDYRAPAQGVGDFLADRVSGELPTASLPVTQQPAAPLTTTQPNTIQLPITQQPVAPLPVAPAATVSLSTYRPGVVPANLRDCLPKEVGEVLAGALGRFDRQIRGFTGQAAVLTGVETRTSAPVRLVRNTQCCSVNTPGLYPAGEGAGYAGGIISAAVDGMRVAEAIIQAHALPEGTFLPQG